MEQTVYISPLGPLTLYAEKNSLTALVYGNHGGQADSPLLREAKKQLEEYFAGTRRQFSLPLAPAGTDFQRRMWRALGEIPCGAVLSYKELAERAGCPRGYQAVGQANRKNPLPILIPCHRVVGADGKIGGYAYGTAAKRFLLRLEGMTEEGLFRD